MATTLHRPDVARRLASIMVAQRRGRNDRDYGKVAGKIDKRALCRISTGSGRLFYTEGTPSPTRLRLVLVLDMSGSMMGSTFANGMQVCRDLMEATKSIATVDCEVWGHTTAGLVPGDHLDPSVQSVSEGAYIVVKELWRKGQTIATFEKRCNEQRLYGNEDGFALQIIGDEVHKTLKSGERGLIVMVSDGAPAYREYAIATKHVRSVTANLRRRGMSVVSVSCSMGLPAATQREMYGHDAIVNYTSDTNALVRDMARAIGKALD